MAFVLNLTKKKKVVFEVGENICFILVAIDRDTVDGLGVEATLAVCLLQCQLSGTVVG